MKPAAPEEFQESVQHFQKTAGFKIDTLKPFRVQIDELRHKGASFQVISRLLLNLGVSVSAETVRRFCKSIAREQSLASDIPSAVQPAPGKTPLLRCQTFNQRTHDGPVQERTGPRVVDPSAL